MIYNIFFLFNTEFIFFVNLCPHRFFLLLNDQFTSSCHSSQLASSKVEKLKKICIWSQCYSNVCFAAFLGSRPGSIGLGQVCCCTKIMNERQVAFFSKWGVVCEIKNGRYIPNIFCLTWSYTYFSLFWVDFSSSQISTFKHLQSSSSISYQQRSIFFK